MKFTILTNCIQQIIDTLDKPDDLFKCTINTWRGNECITNQKIIEVNPVTDLLSEPPVNPETSYDQEVMDYYKKLNLKKRK